ARGHPGMDAGAGAAPPSRDLLRRGSPLPTSRQSSPVLRPDIAALGGHAEAERTRTLGAVAAWYLRRLTDCSRSNRRSRGSGHRPAVVSSPRILADEAVGR